MREKIDLANIEIKDLTIVVNLRLSKAASYLNFRADTKTIKALPGGANITSEMIQNNFLIIRIPSTSFQSKIIDVLCSSLVKNKLIFIAIDEVFPNDNHHLLQRQDCAHDSRWVVDRQFIGSLSLITVK